MRDPLVSVVMPAYNAARFLREAVESILAQTFECFEFIIVYDDSQDKTLQILNTYAAKDKRIKILKNVKRAGPATAVNEGIRVSKGKYIARMDADDVAVKERLEREVGFLLEHPEVGIVGTAIYLMNESGEVYGKRAYCTSDEDIRQHIFRFSPFAQPTVMISKDALLQVGLYDPSLLVAEDYELWFRLGTVGQFANLDEYLLYYRIHECSMTASRLREMQKNTLKVRVKAWREYSYRWSSLDLGYFIGGSLVPLLLPPRATLRLFNWIRGRSL